MGKLEDPRDIKRRKINGFFASPSTAPGNSKFKKTNGERGRMLGFSFQVEERAPI